MLDHKEKSSEKYPKVQSVEKTSCESFFVLQSVFAALIENFFKSAKLVRYVVLVEAKFTAADVFGGQPFDKT